MSSNQPKSPTFPPHPFWGNEQANADWSHALNEHNRELVLAQTTRAQELMLHQWKLFRALFDNSHDAIEVIDPATMRFLDVNGKECLDLGYTREELLEMTVYEIDPQATLDFRLIAATNRDLACEVTQNQFRSDLFYRLHVFPVRIPPLRERRDDIPLLVEHFVQKIARRMGKSITSIPARAMDALAAGHWPGNVRELENFIERSVILTNGSVLAVPLNELEIPETYPKDERDTLEEAERRHIIEALRQSNGRISGKRGAAARLGLKRTTLQSKLKQMRINPRTPPAF